MFVKRSEMLRNFWTKKVNDGQEHEGTPAKPVEINVQNHFANTVRFVQFSCIYYKVYR